MSQEGRARLAIVEDHDGYREVVREVLEEVPGLEVVWDCAEASEALGRLEAGPGTVDVVVVDLSLPDLNGAELVAAIGRRCPDVRCVIVSGHSRRAYVERSLAAGAMAYVLKGSPAELRTAVAAVLTGEQYVSPRLLRPNTARSKAT